MSRAHNSRIFFYRLFFCLAFTLFSGMSILPLLAETSAPKITESPLSLKTEDNIIDNKPEGLVDEKILEKTQRISESIMSPYCPGRTLSSCPSPDARSLRMEITTWLTRGYSEEAVHRQLKGMFGYSVQAEPETKGFGIFAWTAPFVIISFLALLLFFILKRLKWTYKSEPNEDNENIQTIEKELENELKKRN